MNARWLVPVVLWVSACVKAPGSSAAARPGVVIIAAGDVSAPELTGQVLTAALVESQHPEAVLVLGDAQYGEGTPEQFAQAYAPTWGRFKDLTRPVPGNHEYKSGAVGYFGYFGARAGEPGKGYYSFDLGAWHLVALNTSDGCRTVRCDADSEQLAWLEADLASTVKKCVLAYWHHPRFSSGRHGSFAGAAPLWKVLTRHHVELALNGHEHLYERLGPVDESGALADGGLVQLTIGTGGIGFTEFGATPVAASLVRQNDTLGVMRLKLGDDGWEADFLGVPGSTFTDHASGACR